MIEQFGKKIAGKVAPLAEQVFVESGLEKSQKIAGTEGENALENVSELINAAALYDQQAEQPSLIDYLQQISLFSDVDSYDKISDRVALITLHSAKGLEFENVFIIGVEDGLLPHERSCGFDEETEEERRLFFVGITRAKSALFISHAGYRTIRGQLLRSLPSPFLFELGIEAEEYTDDNGGSEILIPEFVPGQLVRHKVFGPGRVKQFVDMGENSVVVVKFNSGETKTLMIKYADLS